jgi:hypothetical protein
MAFSRNASESLGNEPTGKCHFVKYRDAPGRMNTWPSAAHAKKMAAANRSDVESNMSDADDAVYGAKVNVEPSPLVGVANRVCGECTACCTIMAVDELNKGNYQGCPHDCGRCAIYDARPRTCRNWSCGWLLGHIEGDERQRPDKLGLMFNRERLGGEMIPVVYEVWPGAGREANNAALLGEMSQKMPIILRDFQTRKCHVLTLNPRQRQAIVQMIQDEWYLYGYTQVVISNSYPFQ